MVHESNNCSGFVRLAPRFVRLALWNRHAALDTFLSALCQKIPNALDLNVPACYNIRELLTISRSAGSFFRLLLVEKGASRTQKEDFSLVKAKKTPQQNPENNYWKSS